MQLEVPDMLPPPSGLKDNPLEYFIKLSPEEIILHDIEMSPSPLTFLHKYVLGLSLPVAVAYSYVENLQANIVKVSVLAKEKGSPENLLTLIHAIDKYLTSVVDFWNNVGRRAHVEYSVLMNIHASVLNMSNDTDSIRKLTRVFGLEQYSESHMAFNKLHADLLDEMHECYLNRTRIRTPKPHLSLVKPH